ncbi:unnamed protein product [Caenorhabditis sp. 36 PRJEB53466]|nr:unnamed protein product [Caenorhabditis sp. 36 PRJEB53466]
MPRRQGDRGQRGKTPVGRAKQCPDLNADGTEPGPSNVSNPVNKNKRKTIASPLPPPLKNAELDSDDYSDNEVTTDNKHPISDDPSFEISQQHIETYEISCANAKTKYSIPAAEIDRIENGEEDGEVELRLPSKIQLGRYIIESWFGSPFPLEYIYSKMVIVCEYCLAYTGSQLVMNRHVDRCAARGPPGKEIYRDSERNLSVFEVDGGEQKDYCQRLCLISRLFLASKSVFFDTEAFHFYVVTVNDQEGWHIAGYFSKEKYQPDLYNLSCVMILPPFQAMGLGRLLIDVSYALSRREEWLGGPEEPLSEHGLAAYGKYWRDTIFKLFALERVFNAIENDGGYSVVDVSEETGIHPQDCLRMLDLLGWLVVNKEKGPDETGTHSLLWDVDWEFVEKYHYNPSVFDEKLLDWQPSKDTPMDGFYELTRANVNEGMERMRIRQDLQETPMRQDQNMEKSTPATSSAIPPGSQKKGGRRQAKGQSYKRNLKKELTKRVTVSDEKSDSSDDEDSPKTKKKTPKRKRCAGEPKFIVLRNSLKSLGGTALVTDAAAKKDVRKREEDSSDGDGDDAPAPSSGRRCSQRAPEKKPSAAEKKPPASSTSSEKRKHRKKKEVEEDKTSKKESESDSTSSEDDDDVPFKGRAKGHKGKKDKPSKNVKKGEVRKRQCQIRVVCKKFPPSSGKKEWTHYQKPVEEEVVNKEKRDSDGEHVNGDSKTEATEEIAAEDDHNGKDQEANSLKQEKEVKDDGGDGLVVDLDVEEEELARDYVIGTPASYHSDTEEFSPPQAREFSKQEPIEENDSAPPLLVSQVAKLHVSQPAQLEIEESDDAPPPLLHNENYSSEDDDAPPRLSPQYGKQENHVHDEENEKEKSPLMMGTVVANNTEVHHGGQYHGTRTTPPAMHMPPMQSNPNILPTPQHPYSHHGPGSLQPQTTPGSGGVPSCGRPVYSHTTPEQGQFMSPIAGMPTSVPSVLNNSLESIGTPSTLQQTPQQPQPHFDMAALAMAQMQPDNGLMSCTSQIEQQNQLMMQQHGFNSPPGQTNGILVPPQQAVPPKPVIQPTPAPATGRRRSEAAAPRKRAPRAQAQAALTIQPPQFPMPPMTLPYYPGTYGAPYQMWDPSIYQFNPYYPTNMQHHVSQAAYHQQFMAYQYNQTGQMGANAAAAAAIQPQNPAVYPSHWFPNQNMR